LMALAYAVKDDNQSQGVLLTNTEASGTVRIQLKNGIEKIGQGVTDDLPKVVKDFLKRLQEAGITDSSLCARIRIVIRDLEPGSSGEEETFAALRKVLAEPIKSGPQGTLLSVTGLISLSAEVDETATASSELSNKSGFCYPPCLRINIFYGRLS